MSELRPLVVKVGGGLLRDEGLEGLRRACAEVNELATKRPVLVVPGGGPFADAVRAVDAQVGLTDGVAHVLALRAMDQLGAMLAPLLPAAEPLSDLVAPRALGLLAVAPAFAGRPEVPESWAVTSDSSGGARGRRDRRRRGGPAQAGPRGGGAVAVGRPAARRAERGRACGAAGSAVAAG